MNNIHFKAQSGWINDPNGLCFFKGQYHLFYQYFPYDLKWGTMHWGHATTTDFINYEHHPIALFPSIEADQNGVFSGSAFIENNKMNLFYTGVKYNNFASDIHRYGDQLFTSKQLKITSDDGFTFDNFKDKQVVIDVLNRPIGDPIHTRDPKVWKKGDNYYLLLGSNVLKDNVQQGALLFFESTDLTNFKLITTYTQSDMGHMWECPDYFELNNQGYVVMSPEGTMPECEYPSHVYIAAANFDYHSNLELRSKLELIDIGLDCYAPQTFEDENNNRVLISWIRMPEPIEDKTIGCFTMPRVISNNNRVISYSVHHLIEQHFKLLEKLTVLDRNDIYKVTAELQPGESITIGNYRIDNQNNQLVFDRTKCFTLGDPQLNIVTSSQYQASITIEVYYDGYVIETFINNGLEVCTHVIYEQENHLNIKSTVNYDIYKLEK